MDASAQAIHVASAPLPQVNLHPLVPLHVYNQFVRRKQTSSLNRVIGALLGFKTEQVRGWVLDACVLCVCVWGGCLLLLLLVG
jgi:hypothetical protein